MIILLIISNGLTCFGRYFRPSSGALDRVYSLWYKSPTMMPDGDQDAVNTSCKNSLVLLRMGESIAQNMLSRFKLLIKLLLMYLVGCLYYYSSDARSHKHEMSCSCVKRDFSLGTWRCCRDFSLGACRCCCDFSLDTCRCCRDFSLGTCRCCRDFSLGICRCCRDFSLGTCRRL